MEVVKLVTGQIAELHRDKTEVQFQAGLWCLISYPPESKPSMRYYGWVPATYVTWKMTF